MAGAPEVILFDGDCGYCRRQMERIRRAAPAGVFAYLARQTPGIEQRYPELAAASLEQGLRFVDAAGRMYVGADAVYEVARRVPRWRLAAQLYRVPGLRQLFRALYRWVAKNRRRFGAAETCDLPRAGG